MNPKYKEPLRWLGMVVVFALVLRVIGFAIKAFATGNWSLS